MTPGTELSQGTLAVVLAGGKGTRLGPLTRNICKPALPFGAAYRNIDFTLSNCVNSGIRRIGVATQHKAHTLLRHLDEVWGSSPGNAMEFVDAWAAQQRAPQEGYKGTADAVYRNLDLIRQHDPERVLVLAGDHVYRMDYRPMLEFHRRARADVTVGCIEVDASEASQFGILVRDAHGRIRHFVEKPKDVAQLPGRGRLCASMGIYVFDTGFLARVLRRDAFRRESRHDFGGDVLPGLLHEARAFAYPFRDPSGGGAAYWRDVGTPSAYWRAHLELLDASPSLDLEDPGWPLRGAIGRPRLTSSRDAGGDAPGTARSLVAVDSDVSGRVRRSVLFSGVHVAGGALVDRSVVLPGAVIGRNARLSGVIVDAGCRVPDGTIIGPSHNGAPDAGSNEPVVLTAEDFLSDAVVSYA